MQNRPLIGLTGRRIQSARIVDSLPVLAEADVDVYYSSYSRSVISAGGIPVHIPLDVEAPALVEHVDGLLFCGGADIDPARYGAERSSDVEPPEYERDRLELALIGEAFENEVPVLGICRGMQLLNVSLGGSLHQHVPSHAKFDAPVDSETHSIEIADGSLLQSFYGSICRVNSLHHQTVDRIGSDLTVVARSDDGSVEAVEHEFLPVVGVQWHPEMLAGCATDPIFPWLVEQASARMKTRLG